MLAWIVILAFAVSSSIDNLAVGISYGMQDIRIGARKNILVAVICFLMSIGGISFGVWIGSFLPGMVPVIVGAFLLTIIGMRIILLVNPRKKGTMKENVEHTGKSGRFKDILRNLKISNADNFGDIGWGEAIFLGVALSANALTNGLGAGLLGFSPLAISLMAAIGSYFNVWVGVKVGAKLRVVRIGKYTVGQFGTILSGVIIIIIAITSICEWYAY